MKPYKILVYLAVLIALVAYIYFVEIGHKRAEHERKEKQSLIVQLDRDKINEIRIMRHDDKPIEIKKSESGEWKVVSPVDTMGDEKAIQDLLAACTLAQPEKTVMEKDVNWKDYGLDKPDLELALSQPGKEAEISFGASNPAKSSYYLKLKGDPRLFLVPDTLRISLNKTLFDLRDKTVAKIFPDQVDKIQILQNGRETDLERQDGKWRIVAPIEATAKAQLVKSLLSSLGNLKAKEIIDESKTEDNAYGLKDSGNSIYLSGKDFNKTITLGSFKENNSETGKTGGSVYVSVSGQSPIYLVNDRFFKSEKLDPASLTDRSVVFIEPMNVEKILIEFDGKHWELAHASDNRWKMEQPERRDKLETWLVSQMLWSLRDLNYKSVISPIPDDIAPYRLNMPQLVVSIYQKGSQNPVKLTLGWPVPEEPQTKDEAGADPQKTGGGQVGEATKTAPPAVRGAAVPKILYATVEPPNDRPVIYVLDGGIIGKLRVDLEQLLKKE